MTSLENSIVRAIETSELVGKKVYIDHKHKAAIDEDGNRTFVRKMSNGDIKVFEETKVVATLKEGYFLDVYVRVIAELVK